MTREDAREIFLDRLDRLAVRLEDEGRYVDAVLVGDAYIALARRSPPKWSAAVARIWHNNKVTPRVTEE